MSLLQRLTKWLLRQAEPASLKAPERIEASAPAARVRRPETQRRPGWVPPTHVVKLKGLQLSGGLLYTGSTLDAPGAPGIPDPALINPALPVDFRHPDRAGEQMRYWPSYAQIPPACRAAYLEWLAAGRRGDVYIGYVFLFFYGLERRVLVEAPHLLEAKADIPLIIAEVRRLLELYDQNNSFHGYATNFLAVARLIHGVPDLSHLTPPQAPAGWDFPVELKIALGHFVRRGEPIPGDWAFAWLKSHPDLRLRTPATRCATEFRELFLQRYRDAYGAGMTIRPNKTRLRIAYRPASAAFRQPVEFDVGDLPDVTRLSTPTKRLMALAEQVTDELDAYSRWIGKHGSSGYKLPALALLPADFAAGKAELAPFESWLDQQFGTGEHVSVPVRELMAKWSAGSTATISKRDAELFSRLLERCGCGIEPDVRFGGMNLSKSASAMLFRLPANAPSEPSDAYKAASALARLGILVAMADEQLSTDEQRFLDRHVTNALLLSSAEQVRLRAHLHWAISSPADFSGLKERCATLNDGQRQRFGQFLVGVASADGRITPDEMKSLGKTYRLLGLNTEDVAHDIHALATTTEAPAGAPVTIIPADDIVPSFAIPPEPSRVSPAAIELSTEKVAAILSETHVVTSILEQVFVEAEPESVSECDEVEVETRKDDRIPGLDESHTTLVRHLMERPMWARYEVDGLSERLGLLTAGAIETINDVAFSVADEPFAEGDDPIEINAAVFVDCAFV